jgi:hypothetical protein
MHEDQPKQLHGPETSASVVQLLNMVKDSATAPPEAVPATPELPFAEPELPQPVLSPVTEELEQPTDEQLTVALPAPQPQKPVVTAKTREFPKVDLAPETERPGRRWKLAIPAGATALVAAVAAGIFASPYVLKNKSSIEPTTYMAESPQQQSVAPYATPTPSSHIKIDRKPAERRKSKPEKSYARKTNKATTSTEAPNNTVRVTYQATETDTTPATAPRASAPASTNEQVSRPITPSNPKPIKTPEPSTGGAIVDPYLGAEDTGGASPESETKPAQTGGATVKAG